MPELPEVTTVIGILKNEIIGKTIDNIEILYRNIIESDINSFACSALSFIPFNNRYSKVIYLL